MGQHCLHLLGLVTCVWRLLGCQSESTPQCKHQWPDCGGSGIDGADDVALLQTQLQRIQSPSREKLHVDGGEPLCTEMTDRGAYFSVEVQVGTPSQSFDIVADTGSNAFMIPDCRCVLALRCSTMDECFRTSDSSSFLLNTDEQGLSPIVTLTYGSGSIQCTIASDNVTVGGAHAYMENGVFLIESRLGLAVDSSFEGILGLGLPGSDLGLDTDFMPAAGISRFSVCFNDVGILRMNMPPLLNSMGNIGSVHWGLDLQGMSVDPAAEDVLFCDPSSKRPGMQTACGAIPDTGTTFTLGPANQIRTLFAAICDAWPRCNALAEQSPSTDKSILFSLLVGNCTDWMHDTADGINEIPPIYIHLAGAEGVPQKVPLTAWSYVILTPVPVFKTIHQNIHGIDVRIIFPVGMDLVCVPMFDAINYLTVANGPVWILGSSLFWDHIVSFDLGTDPKAIAISDQPCTSCKASLMATSVGSDKTSKRVHRSLRRIDTPRGTSVNRTRGF
mmetsp:Transcript_78997/g.144006  ORF Transcript_78997/g.144006 Transcript_78997/m.144006 type:complete len:501 (-) Transcript_78997:153-1655(-)